MMAEPEPEPMQQRWCCLACGWQGTFGKLVMYSCQYVGCPQCRSANIHPATGDVVELEEYHGPIGTRN